jgi:hypothetical protein
MDFVGDVAHEEAHIEGLTVDIRPVEA